MEEIKFTKELEDIRVTSLNTKVTFECEISRENLKLEWYRGSKAIKRDLRHDIEAVGKTHRLVIDKVTSEDVGDYRAEYLHLTTSGKLSVEGIVQVLIT